MYEIFFTEDAETLLAKLDKVVAQRILKKLRWLAENFDAITPESLTAQLQGFYKLRVGDYRVLYWVEAKNRQIIIHLIGHRRTIYKQK
jgi:mRNA interferase RelE/StbE